MKNKIAFFDIDGTLYKGNSTFDFIAYINKDNEEYKYFRKKYRYLRAYNKILNKLFHYDWYKLKSVLFLQGLTSKELDELAESFYNDVLVSNIIVPMMDIFNFYKVKGYKLVLVTATLDPIAKIIAKKIDADDYISTDLIYNNDICSGKYKIDILNNKLDIVKKKYDLENVISVFYSDNHQDIPLLRKTTLGAFIVK